MHGQPAGTWSDDTSLTLCLLDNLDRKLNDYKIMHSFDRIHKVSALTHAHPLSFLACDIYVSLGILLLHGGTIPEAYERVTQNVMQYGLC